MGNRPLKRQPLTEKLVTAARIDDPDAAEIAVSYPDKWELVHHVRRLDNNPRY